MPQLTPAKPRRGKSYDQRYDDPGLKCSPANIFFWLVSR